MMASVPHELEQTIAASVAAALGERAEDLRELVARAVDIELERVLASSSRSSSSRGETARQMSEPRTFPSSRSTSRARSRASDLAPTPRLCRDCGAEPVLKGRRLCRSCKSARDRERKVARARAGDVDEEPAPPALPRPSSNGTGRPRRVGRLRPSAYERERREERKQVIAAARDEAELVELDGRTWRVVQLPSAELRPSERVGSRARVRRHAEPLSSSID
jgi:hypothetical protein